MVDAIAARGDPIAAATLAALAVLAPAGLASYAQDAAVRLAGGGVTHPAVAQIGTLSVESAAAGVDEGTEMIVAVLARPGYRDRQVLVLGIDVATDALIECMLTPPLSRKEAERLLREPTSDASAPPLAGLATDELSCHPIIWSPSCRAAAHARHNTSLAQNAHAHDRPATRDHHDSGSTARARACRLAKHRWLPLPARQCPERKSPARGGPGDKGGLA